MPLRYDSLKTTGNLNGKASGSLVNGNALDIGDNARQKARNLSALVTATLATASLTVTCKWQVSNDGTTWVDVANGSQNAASVTFSTGTSGAVSKAIEAPSTVYGWRKARIAFTTGGAAGAAGDTYALSYCFRAGC